MKLKAIGTLVAVTFLGIAASAGTASANPPSQTTSCLQANAIVSSSKCDAIQWTEYSYYLIGGSSNCSSGGVQRVLYTYMHVGGVWECAATVTYATPE